jgi:zinc transport system substrate-binding protein
MNKIFFSLFIYFLPAVLMANEALRVFVSIPPQQYLVERIGQKFVDVKVMLKAGDSPETFDPTLKQITQLNNAQIYFRIGVAFEKKWIRSLEKNNIQTKIINCCEDIIERRSVALDNHVWASARNAQLLAAMIKQALIDVDPGHALQYEQNYMDLIVELEQLDNEIYALLSQRRTDYFIISHAALGHFAEDYGLIQLSLENSGKELGPRSLVKIIKHARKEKIQTLFLQKQHKTATAMAFANEIGAEQIEVDPLHGDYIANLRNITNLIAGATR